MLPNSWGGSEFLWSQTALWLLEKGYDVTVSVEFRSEEPRILKKLQAGFATMLRRNSPTPLPPPATLPVRSLRYIARRIAPTRSMQLTEIETIERVRPALVVVSQPTCVEGIEWMLACQQLSIPYVTIAQACHDQLFDSDKFAAAIEPALCGAMRSYFVAEDNRTKMENFLARSLPSSEIVRNPFQVQYCSSLPWPVEGSVLKLAHVARLHIPSKGQDILLQLLALEKWRQRPVTVCFYGKGPNEGRLQQLARKLELRGVSFRGHVDDIEKIWREHHALLMPSRHEGLPIALVEALLCGRPAVVTDVAGNPEVMIDGITGIVAAAPTISAFDNAMERLWQCRDKLPDMGQAAGRHIRSLVPPDPVAVFAQKLVGLLDSGLA